VELCHAERRDPRQRVASGADGACACGGPFVAHNLCHLADDLEAHTRDREEHAGARRRQSRHRHHGAGAAGRNRQHGPRGGGLQDERRGQGAPRAGARGDAAEGGGGAQGGLAVCRREFRKERERARRRLDPFGGRHAQDRRRNVRHRTAFERARRRGCRGLQSGVGKRRHRGERRGGALLLDPRRARRSARWSR